MTAREAAPLRRALGLTDATTLGLASMVGAGVFVAFGPAAAAAGPLLLVGLLLAAVVAVCNAASSVQLAVQDPQAGGAYLWGRTHLGQWPGFVAGLCFVVGKTASCAAIALAIAAYAAPPPARVPVALLALAAVTGVNCLGVQRTARAARVALVPVVAVLVLAIAVAAPTAVAAPGLLDVSGTVPSPASVLQAAALLFFAFAGYARITTLAEEVRSPASVLPRAVAIAVAGALMLYLAGALVLLAVLGPADLAASRAPWLLLAERVGPWLSVPLQVAGIAAAAGSLLALVAGVSRTALAMARRRDLPAPLAHVHPRFATPVRAEVAAAVVAGALVTTGDLTLVIGCSSFAVLLYYLVANLSALRQPRTARIVPRAVPVLGGAGCALLALSLPWQAAAATSGVLLLGCGVRWLALRRRTP